MALFAQAARTAARTTARTTARTGARRSAFRTLAGPILPHRSMSMASLPPARPLLNSSTKLSTLHRHYSTPPPPLADVSIDEYHELADETMELILDNFELLAESHPAVDVELAQGVLTLRLPPNGSYVVNKQPANKQIWWASPLSGPKRFDLVEGNKWVYSRDGKTLGDCLREETKLVTDERGLEPVAFEGIDDA